MLGLEIRRCIPAIWPEGNVTLDYLSTLNGWGKRFNVL